MRNRLPKHDVVLSNTAELHLSGLIGVASHTVCRKSASWDFSLKIGCNGSFKWKKILQTAILGYMFIYVQIKH
jgi:hypothetical protein